MQWREKIKILNNSEFESLENLAKVGWFFKKKPTRLRDRKLCENLKA